MESIAFSMPRDSFSSFKDRKHESLWKACYEGDAIAIQNIFNEVGKDEFLELLGLRYSSFFLPLLYQALNHVFVIEKLFELIGKEDFIALLKTPSNSQEVPIYDILNQHSDKVIDLLIKFVGKEAFINLLLHPQNEGKCLVLHAVCKNPNPNVIGKVFELIGEDEFVKLLNVPYRQEIFKCYGPLGTACAMRCLDVIEKLFELIGEDKFVRQLNDIFVSSNHLMCNAEGAVLEKIHNLIGKNKFIDLLNVHRTTGSTLLQSACWRNELAIIEKLVELLDKDEVIKLMDARTTDACGYTLLDCACATHLDKSALLQKLYEFLGQDEFIKRLSITNNLGRTPIYEAFDHISMNKMTIQKLFELTGVDVFMNLLNFEDLEKQTPLHVAAKFGSHRVFEILLELAQTNPLFHNRLKTFIYKINHTLEFRFHRNKSNQAFQALLKHLDPNEPCSKFVYSSFNNDNPPPGGGAAQFVSINAIHLNKGSESCNTNRHFDL